MEKQIRHNWFLMIVLLLLSLVASWFMVNYLVDQVGKTADEEALTHIVENTEQLHYSFHNRTSDTWSIMEIESLSLSKLSMASEADVVESIAQLREKSAACQIWLINAEGQCLDDEGNTGWRQIDEGMLPLLKDGKEFCSLRQETTGGDYLDFAIRLDQPVTEQNYTILMMEYTLDTYLEVLRLQTYGGAGVAYVVDGQGCTLFQTKGEIPTDRTQNYFFYQFVRGMSFEGNEEVTDEESLKNAVNNNETGAVYVSDEQYSYALSYRPLDIMDWHLILMVECSAIAGGRMEYMQQVKWIAVGVNLLIMAVCIGFFLINSLWMRRHSDQKLSSRERIINVLSTNSQGVYILVDAWNWTCTFVSQSAEEMLGVPFAALRGNHLKKLFDTFHNRQMERSLQKWDGKTIFEFGRFLFRPKKSTDEKYLRLLVFPPQDGEIVMAIVDETTDAMREQALEDAVNLAREANQAKSTFLSSMSHDIRTPMNAILGFAALAQSNVENMEKVKDYLRKIQASGNHLLSLINDVLDMSQIESGKIHLEEQETNLSDIFRDIKTIICGQVQEKHLKLSMDIDVKQQHVLCDKTRLNQVLLNLLSNAIKFTPPGGVISMHLTQHSEETSGQGAYEIRVKDNGIGMSREFAENIFEPFERERSSTVDRIQGTGLGMAITKNIIDLMGGTIEVHTEKGKGTEFIICLSLRLLPEHCMEEKQRDESTMCEKPLSFDGKHLLLVEDNDLNREIICELLEDYGFQIDAVENGEEALERAAESKAGYYDVILMDIQMPVMDGYEATRRIRALENKELSQIPILAMTANAFEEDRRAAEACGMDGFLSKPIDIEEVIRVLKSVIRSW